MIARPRRWNMRFIGCFMVEFSASVKLPDYRRKRGHRPCSIDGVFVTGGMAMHQQLERPLSALDTIFTRRSVRGYAPQVLNPATVRSLLDAAVQAPTALHAEPWAFVVVQDRSLLKRLSDRAKGKWAGEASHDRDLHPAGDPAMSQAFAERVADPAFCIFYDASTLIVICARMRGPFVEADCWLAAENLMLAATALGLGTCCIGSAIPVLNSPETKAELGIPADVQAVAPIIVGVSSGAAGDVPRKAPEIVSWTSAPR
jgi:nitroreductase